MVYKESLRQSVGRRKISVKQTEQGQGDTVTPQEEESPSQGPDDIITVQSADNECCVHYKGTKLTFLFKLFSSWINLIIEYLEFSRNLRFGSKTIVGWRTLSQLYQVSLVSPHVHHLQEGQGLAS